MQKEEEEKAKPLIKQSQNVLLTSAMPGRKIVTGKRLGVKATKEKEEKKEKKQKDQKASPKASPKKVVERESKVSNSCLLVGSPSPLFFSYSFTHKCYTDLH